MRVFRFPREFFRLGYSSIGDDDVRREAGGNGKGGEEAKKSGLDLPSTHRRLKNLGVVVRRRRL